MIGPRFQDEFLESLAVSFRKRRKSLSHRTRRAEVAKVYELVDGKKLERLEIDLVKYDEASLRLHAWPDRLIWLDARRLTKKGWAWSWTREGRLLGEPRLVIAALEQTLDILFEMDASRTRELDGPWSQLLARGPIEIR